MRILYVSSGPLPSRYANSVHVMKMGQALAGDGHAVRVISPEYNREGVMPDAPDLHAWYGVQKNFDVKKTPRLKPAKLGQLVHAGLACREARAFKADLVYARCFTSAWLAAKTGLPVVFEQHVLYKNSDLQQTMYRSLLNSPQLKALVVISDALKHLVVEQTGFPADKIIVAHDGADFLEISSPAPFSARPGRLQAGYTGHLYEGRGIDLIGVMAEKLPGVDFNIVGGEAAHVALWKERFGPRANIHFYGFIAPADVPRYIAAFDILLAPYQKKVSVRNMTSTEQWMSPLKIFEYMASGKPMICSDMPVLREVLRDGENALLCPPDDADAWVAALEKLRGDQALANAIGDTAQNDFKAHYSWKSRAKGIMKAIAELDNGLSRA